MSFTLHEYEWINITTFFYQTKKKKRNFINQTSNYLQIQMKFYNHHVT